MKEVSKLRAANQMETWLIIDAVHLGGIAGGMGACGDNPSVAQSPARIERNLKKSHRQTAANLPPPG